MSNGRTIYSVRISQYFPEPYASSGGNVKVELDLSNNAMKADLKGVTGTQNEP